MSREPVGQLVLCAACFVVLCAHHARCTVYSMCTSHGLSAPYAVWAPCGLRVGSVGSQGWCPSGSVYSLGFVCTGVHVYLMLTANATDSVCPEHHG